MKRNLSSQSASLPKRQKTTTEAKVGSIYRNDKVDAYIANDQPGKLIDFLMGPRCQTDTKQEASESIGRQPWPGQQGYTLWHYAISQAASSGKTDTLLKLLEHKPNGVSTLGAQQWPGEKRDWIIWHFAIVKAAISGKTDTLFALLEHKPNGTSSALGTQPWPGKPGCAHWHFAFFVASRHGKTDTLLKLLEHKPAGASSTLGAQPWPGKPGWAHWHLIIRDAARSGKTDTLLKLLEHKPNGTSSALGTQPWPGKPGNPGNPGPGWALWHFAIFEATSHGKTDTLLKLLEHKPNGTSSALGTQPWPREPGWAIRHYAMNVASCHGKTDTLLKLLEHKPNGTSSALGTQPWPSKPGWELWHFAIFGASSFGKTDTLLKLLEHKPDGNHKPDGASLVLGQRQWPGEPEGLKLWHFAIVQAANYQTEETIDAVLEAYSEKKCDEDMRPLLNKIKEKSIYCARKYIEVVLKGWCGQWRTINKPRKEKVMEKTKDLLNIKWLSEQDKEALRETLFNIVHVNHGLNPFDLIAHLQLLFLDLKKQYPIQTGVEGARRLRILCGTKIYERLLFFQTHLPLFDPRFFLWNEPKLMALLEHFKPLGSNGHINKLPRSKILLDDLDEYSEQIYSHFMDNRLGTKYRKIQENWNTAVLDEKKLDRGEGSLTPS